MAKTYSIAEAAEVLNKSVPTLHRWIKQGRIETLREKRHGKDNVLVIPETEIHKLRVEIEEEQEQSKADMQQIIAKEVTGYLQNMSLHEGLQNLRREIQLKDQRIEMLLQELETRDNVIKELLQQNNEKLDKLLEDKNSNFLSRLFGKVK